MTVMNALVLYVGIQAIAQIQSKGLIPAITTIAHSAHMDIFQNLAVDLDTEGEQVWIHFYEDLKLHMAKTGIFMFDNLLWSEKKQLLIEDDFCVVSGRYLFLNGIANQLRYPNSHTHYFSCTLLYLFAESNTEAIQEQITRVLLERLIVNRPHPWGLLITFIELIKNPTFKFWSHEFVKCAPEIEKLVVENANDLYKKKYLNKKFLF